MLRVHRIPFSTNVERVALAAGHKGVEVEWVDHDPEDRSRIVALSGQDLFPVLERSDATFLVDSPEILRELERDVPDPPLWPADARGRAGADVFVGWFNGVWKGPPNRLADGVGDAEADARRLRASRDTFEGLLDGRDFLLGDAFGIADVIAWPFLRYARGLDDPADRDPFHAVLVDHLDLSGHPRTAAWIARVDILSSGWADL